MRGARSRSCMYTAMANKWKGILFCEEMLILLIYASVTLHLVSCQTITSTLLDGKYACPGQEVIFNCTTNGSLVMAWSSDEYIGSSGDQLEITPTYSLGDILTSMVNHNTFAELTMKKGGLVTESQLHVAVSQDIPSTVVTCMDVSNGSYSSVHFELMSLPDMPQDVSAFEVTPSPGDDCILVINWIPPSNANTSLVKQYIVEAPSGNFTTKTAKTEIAVALLVHHCDVGSNAHIRIYAIDSCGRHGNRSDNSITVITELFEKKSNSSLSVTTQHTKPIIGGQRQQNSCAAAIVGGVLGGFIGLMILIIVITLSISLRLKIYKTVDFQKKKLKEADPVDDDFSNSNPETKQTKKQSKSTDESKKPIIDKQPDAADDL